MSQLTQRIVAFAAGLVILLGGCGGDKSDSSGSRGQSAGRLDRVVKVAGGRGLYVKCAGKGSPTVVLEGGDGDSSASYDFAVPAVSKVARTCVYDRAGLGQSDPPPGKRELRDLVGDLEQLLRAAKIPGPYVLVGTSGGGYIVAGYAYRHPRDTAGLVLVDTGAPLANPPKAIVEETDASNPDNLEKRDYLQVERDAWNARERIGDIPVKVVSVKFSSAAIRESPFPAERAAMRRNLERQRGWLVLSPRSEQIVARTGHAVEEENPQLVIDTILAAVKEAG